MIAASVAFEAEIMDSSRAVCDAAIGKERNRSFRSAYDGPNVLISQGILTFSFP